MKSQWTKKKMQRKNGKPEPELDANYNPPVKELPAIPPDDYRGSQADWCVALVSRGLWDDSDGSWYGDVMIPVAVYEEILEECEGNDFDN